MGSDSPPEYFEAPQGFYVHLSIGEPVEAERIFIWQQTEAGEDAVRETFWAFGGAVDQFGIPWMVNCEKAVDPSFREVAGGSSKLKRRFR